MLRERTGSLEGARVITAEVPTSSQRLWEALPGILSWVVVLSPIWLTLISPPAGLGMVVLATVYFSTRASLYGVRALITRAKVLTTGEADWLAKLREIEVKGLDDWRSHEILDWRACRVTLLVRAYRERNAEMLRATLQSVLDSNWPRDDGMLRNVEVLFATEEEDPFPPPIVEKLAQEFAGRLAVRQIKHPEEPATLPGPSTAMS